MRLLQIHNTVLTALKEKPETRCDDMLLWLEVCKRSPLTNIYALGTNFEEVLKHHKFFNVPSYESVSRARRKIQAKCPELKDAVTAEARAEKVEEYIGYVRADI